MTSPAVQFEDDIHRLSVNGITLPSVTTIIGDLGLVDTSWFTEESAWRGSYVHMLCELHDKEDLAPVEEMASGDRLLFEGHSAYLDGWKEFVKDSGFQAEVIERPMADVERGFAGIPDRYGVIGGKPAVVDIKSGAIIKKAVRLQLAAYVELCRKNVNPVAGVNYRRFAVRLFPDGKYQMREFKDRTDSMLFASALALYNFKKGA